MLITRHFLAIDFDEVSWQADVLAFWRPFVATVSKIIHRKGEQPDPQNYQLSHDAVKESPAILSSFFNYLLQTEYVRVNPVVMIRQKSKFIRKQQWPAKIRCLSELQWAIHYQNSGRINRK